MTEFEEQAITTFGAVAVDGLPDVATLGHQVLPLYLNTAQAPASSPTPTVASPAPAPSPAVTSPAPASPALSINFFFLAITSFFFLTITSIFFLISSHLIFSYAIAFLHPF